METIVRKMTPEMAYEMLLNNTKNRSLKKNVVLEYARQMKIGEWKLTAQGISISDEGVLIDGQHRLAAIVKSKKTIMIPVSTGLNYNDVFKVYDTGIKRTAADALHISGVKYSSKIASTIKRQLVLRNGAKTKVTNKDIHDQYFKHETTYQNVIALGVTLSKKLRLLPLSTLGGIINYLVIDKQHEYNEVESFFDQLYFNRNITNGTIVVLRDKLLNDLIGNKRMTRKALLLNIVKSWNNYVTGVEVKRLTVDLNKDYNIDFL